MNEVLEHEAHDGTDGVRGFESVGVTEGMEKGLKIVTLRLARQWLERGRVGEEGRERSLGHRQ